MNNNDAVIEFLLNQLRQQLTNNPYKQQCEDLAHEVLSLKNQLRDASVQIKELHLALATATGDVDACKPAHNGERIYGDPTPRLTGFDASNGYINCGEQSGCRKEDTHEYDHNWIIAPGLFLGEGDQDNVPSSRFCCECGKREWDDEGYKPKEDTQKCGHEWYFYDGGAHSACVKCGLKR